MRRITSQLWASRNALGYRRNDHAGPRKSAQHGAIMRRARYVAAVRFRIDQRSRCCGDGASSSGSPRVQRVTQRNPASRRVRCGRTSQTAYSALPLQFPELVAAKDRCATAANDRCPSCSISADPRRMTHREPRAQVPGTSKLAAAFDVQPPIRVSGDAAGAAAYAPGSTQRRPPRTSGDGGRVNRRARSSSSSDSASSAGARSGSMRHRCTSRPVAAGPDARSRGAIRDHRALASVPGSRRPPRQADRRCCPQRVLVGRGSDCAAVSQSNRRRRMKPARSSTPLPHHMLRVIRMK